MARDTFFSRQRPDLEMKEERNNEIDLLLRRLSRRQEVPVSDADADHLDADELNAYAENAVPAAARARYTEHLADCSKCREIVVQLSASVPVVAAKETVTAGAPSGLRSFLASFFSPMVLRYAVPALGLIVVAAIGFVIMQSTRRAPESVAQVEPAPQSRASITSTEQAEAKSFHTYDKPAESPSPAHAPSGANKAVIEEQEPPPPAAPKPAGEVAAATTEAQKNERQPVVANDATAPPQASPAPAPTVDEMRVDVQGRRNEPTQSRELAKQKAAESPHDQDKKTATVQSAGAGAAAPTTAGRAAQRSETESTFRMSEEAEKDGITRTVMGRRFRKQGRIWVDAAYSSSNAIRDIARGSEAYRALVADEPEIKKFADELDGPFVVVWKGRTYRIR